MSEAAEFPDCGQLEKLRQAIDACRARDIPSLRKQLRALQRRCRSRRPVSRRVARLAAGIQQSRRAVDQRRVLAPVPQYPLVLPVVEQRDVILAQIRSNQVVILCGETGSGKTTQLPKICLELGRGTRGKIGHTQPRRIAAGVVQHAPGISRGRSGAPAPGSRVGRLEGLLARDWRRSSPARGRDPPGAAAWRLNRNKHDVVPESNSILIGTCFSLPLRIRIFIKPRINTGCTCSSLIRL